MHITGCLIGPMGSMRRCGGRVLDKTEVLPGRSRVGAYAVLCRRQSVVQRGLRYLGSRAVTRAACCELLFCAAGAVRDFGLRMRRCVCTLASVYKVLNCIMNMW